MNPARRHRRLLWPFIGCCFVLLAASSRTGAASPELEVKARAIYLVAHLDLPNELAVYDVENQIERLGVSAIPTLVECLRGTADPVAERCYWLLFRVTQYRVPFTGAGYLRDNVTMRDSVAEWERWWRREQDKWAPTTPPMLIPATFDRDRLDLLMRLYVSGSDPGVASYAFREAMRYDWELLIPYFVEMLKDDRIADNLNAGLLGFTGSYDGPWLSMGESRTERNAKIRMYEEWWEKVGRHPPARAVRDQEKRRWLEYQTQESLKPGFRREGRPR